MAVQTTYQHPVAGIPGLVLDTRNRTVVSRAAFGGDGTIQFGAGIIQGPNPGKDAMANDGTGTMRTFEGVVSAWMTTEQRYPGGGDYIKDKETLNVLQQGAVWVRLSEGENPAYGDAVYLAPDGTFSAVDGVALNARFIGSAIIEGIAPAEFFGGEIKIVEVEVEP